MNVRPESTSDLLSSLSELIRTVRQLGHRHHAALGPTGTPVALLKVLRDGDVRVSDLAVRLALAPSVVSRAIVPLERDGLVERLPDPADARACRISLTAAGQQRLAEVHGDYVLRLTELLTSWDEAEVRSAARLMRKLQGTLADGIDAETDLRLRVPALITPS